MCGYTQLEAATINQPFTYPSYNFYVRLLWFQNPETGMKVEITIVVFDLVYCLRLKPAHHVKFFTGHLQVCNKNKSTVADF